MIDRRYRNSKWTFLLDRFKDLSVSVKSVYRWYCFGSLDSQMETGGIRLGTVTLYPIEPKMLTTKCNEAQRCIGVPLK